MSLLLSALAIYLRRREKNNQNEDNNIVVNNINKDGSAQVQYCGTDRKAVSEDGQPLQSGSYRILRFDGNILVLKTQNNN